MWGQGSCAEHAVRHCAAQGVTGCLIGLNLPLPHPARNAPKVPRDRRAVPRPGDLRGRATCRGYNDLAGIKYPPQPLHRQSPALRSRDTFWRGVTSARAELPPPNPCKTSGVREPTIRSRTQSNLREGARTVASPIRTFLPSTRQRQSSCTRRLPWSMPTTSTSAWTMSPGRTGARNFSVWPI